MGLAERVTDRQLSRLSGPRDEVLAQARRSNQLLGCAVVVNTLAVLAGLGNRDGGVRSLWACVGVFWVVMSYLFVRQRRYLGRLANDNG